MDRVSSPRYESVPDFVGTPDFGVYFDAEVGEDLAKQGLGIHRAGDLAEGVLGGAQVFGEQFAGALCEFRFGTGRRLAGAVQGIDMPAACTEGTGFAGATADVFSQRATQFVESGAGFRRHREMLFAGMCDQPGDAAAAIALVVQPEHAGLGVVCGQGSEFSTQGTFGGIVAIFDHRNQQVGMRVFGSRAAHAFAFAGIVAVRTQAGGAGEQDFHVVDVHGFAQHVAGGAGGGGDNGALAAGPRVQQAAQGGAAMPGGAAGPTRPTAAL